MYLDDGYVLVDLTCRVFALLWMYSCRQTEGQVARRAESTKEESKSIKQLYVQVKRDDERKGGKILVV
jgi:hypothetical protein